MGLTRENKAEIKEIVKETITALLTDDLFISKIADKVFNQLSAKFEVFKKECEDKVQLISKVCEEKVDTLEQYTRRNNVRVFGIPEEHGEKLEEKIIAACNKAGIAIIPDNIDRCHRLGIQEEGKFRPVIIKFTSYKHRSALMYNKRKFAGTKIVVKEDLTKIRYALFKECAQRFGFRNVWTADGVIKVKSDNKIWTVKDIKAAQEIEQRNLSN